MLDSSLFVGLIKKDWEEIQFHSIPPNSLHSTILSNENVAPKYIKVLVNSNEGFSRSWYL